VFGSGGLCVHRGDEGLLLQYIMREKGKDQIDGITNYIYIENFPTLATPSYTDLEQQTPTFVWGSCGEGMCWGTKLTTLWWLCGV